MEVFLLIKYYVVRDDGAKEEGRGDGVIIFVAGTCNMSQHTRIRSEKKTRGGVGESSERHG